MASEEYSQLHFNQKNYFLRFKPNENQMHYSSIDRISKHIRHALEYFVDDLKHDQYKTIDRFLNEQNVSEIFLFIGELLLCDDDRFVEKNFIKKIKAIDIF